MKECNCKIQTNKAKPLAYWLPFHYHLIPGRIRFWIASSLFDNYRLTPTLPLCECQIYLKNKIQWPDNKKAAFTLSFDIDTKTGLSKILELKKDPFYKKFKVTVNLVSNKYNFSKEDVDLLLTEGWEIGLHGDNHDSKLAYLSKVKINSRLNNAIAKISNFGFKLNGFRSPSLLYTDNLFECLSDKFHYSSSTSYDDGVNSVKRIFPFYIGKLLELPISMPIDIGLKFLKLSNEDILSKWLNRFNYILENNGYVLLVIHPDKHFFDDQSEKTLRKFLDTADISNTWNATCSEVATFFKVLK